MIRPGSNQEEAMWMFTGYGMGAAGWLLMALFWVALVALVVWAVVRLIPAAAEGTAGRGNHAEEPREILKRRLASGEIDVKTYEQLSAKLDAPWPEPRD
jgi:putative membrane protein